MIMGKGNNQKKGPKNFEANARAAAAMKAAVGSPDKAQSILDFNEEHARIYKLGHDQKSGVNLRSFCDLGIRAGMFSDLATICRAIAERTGGQQREGARPIKLGVIHSVCSGSNGHPPMVKIAVVDALLAEVLSIRAGKMKINIIRQEEHNTGQVPHGAPVAVPA